MYRHTKDPKMVVQNFLLLVFSSLFQIPSFSPVCSSSVFSFTFKIFQTLFLLFSFYCSCFRTLFRPYAFLTVLCFFFQFISIILFYVRSLVLLSSPLFLFYFLPSTLLTILSLLYSFPFSVPVPPSFSCLLPPSSCVMSAGSCQHATPPTSNQPLTSRLPLSHGSPSNLRWVVRELRHLPGWVYELIYHRFRPLISEGLCVWIGRCQRSHAMTPTASYVSPDCFSVCIE